MNRKSFLQKWLVVPILGWLSAVKVTGREKSKIQLSPEVQNQEIYTLKTGKYLFEGLIRGNERLINLDMATYLVSGTEEELVKKETLNLLAVIAKHRESKTGNCMIVEFKRLRVKYKV